MRRTGGRASSFMGSSGAKPDGSASRQGLGRDVLTRIPSAYGPVVDRLCLRRNSLLRLCERAVRRRGDFRWFEHPQEHRHASPEEACRREEAGGDWDGKKPEPEIPSAVAAGSKNGRIRPLIRGFGNDSLDSRNPQVALSITPRFPPGFVAGGLKRGDSGVRQAPAPGAASLARRIDSLDQAVGPCHGVVGGWQDVDPV